MKIKSSFQFWKGSSGHYGYLPWKSWAALRFRPLGLCFLSDCWRPKLALKHEFPAPGFFWDGRGGLAFPIRLDSFARLRLTFLFSVFPEETRRLLELRALMEPGALMEGAFIGTYSTCLFSLCWRFSHQSEMQNLLKMARRHPTYTTVLVKAWLPSEDPEPDSHKLKFHTALVNQTASPRSFRVQKQHYLWCCHRLLQTESTWRHRSQKRSSSEWSAVTSRKPARKAEHFQLHLRQSLHAINWWWTSQQKLLAHQQWEVLAGTPAKKTIQS